MPFAPTPRHSDRHSPSSRPAAYRPGARHAASPRPAGRAAPGTRAASGDPDQLFDEMQAGRLLRVSRRTLQGWRLKGGGPPFVRLGPRCIRYRRADLEEFIAQRLRRSTSEYGPETD